MTPAERIGLRRCRIFTGAESGASRLQCCLRPRAVTPSSRLPLRGWFQSAQLTRLFRSADPERSHAVHSRPGQAAEGAGPDRSAAREARVTGRGGSTRCRAGARARHPRSSARAAPAHPGHRGDVPGGRSGRGRSGVGPLNLSRVRSRSSEGPGPLAGGGVVNTYADEADDQQRPDGHHHHRADRSRGPDDNPSRPLAGDGIPTPYLHIWTAVGA